MNYCPEPSPDPIPDNRIALFFSNRDPNPRANTGNG